MESLRGESLVRVLEDTDALQFGHFRLSSGLHSERYVQCARLLEAPSLASRVGTALAEELSTFQVDSILSPALGGVIIGYATAVALDVPFRFVERKEGRLTLRRGFNLSQGEKVAIVEDVVTTGGSALEAATVAREHGAEVAAVGSIIDRSEAAVNFGAPFVRLLELTVQTYEATACPACQRGEAFSAPGSRLSSGSGAN